MLKDNVFSSMERDVIGEIMNISLGSSATSLSELLGRRVEITVPRINVTYVKDFSYKNLEPAIGVEINFIEGLEGVNLMIWKRSDAKAIIEILLGQDINDEDFIMDEINLSAMCEVMNQMMGSAATALSEFLGKHINISTPISYEIDDNTEFKNKYFNDEDIIIAVGFDLFIEGSVQSQFINVLPLPFGREIVSGFLHETQDISIEDNTKIEEELNIVSEEEKESVSREELVSRQESHREVKKEPKEPAIKPREKEQAPVKIKPMEYDSFDQEEEVLPKEQLTNLDLIMMVPLTISVEIGKTSRSIKEILEFGPGTIIELDKQAGALVDVVVNGKLIAKGEVVVVNDNFGVRIVEILKKDEIVRSL